jgi:hypothetical protein
MRAGMAGPNSGENEMDSSSSHDKEQGDDQAGPQTPFVAQKETV